METINTAKADVAIWLHQLWQSHPVVFIFIVSLAIGTLFHACRFYGRSNNY